MEIVSSCKVPIYEKIKVSKKGWRLAVQWRLKYKRILDNCIFYCDGIISLLLSIEISFSSSIKKYKVIVLFMGNWIA